MAERGTGIPVVVMGLGHIGRAIARAALASPDLHLAAAVDPSPEHAGRKLADLLGSGPDLTIAGDAAEALAKAKGGVVLHATGSRFEKVYEQLAQAVKAGCHVVSTCEELAFPWLSHEEQADELDDLCEKHQVAVVGTGVNPGFALDRVPAFLSQICGAVRHVKGVRVVDSSTRRPALQKKTGAGLTQERFHELVEQGELGHVGLPESAALAALGCGLEVDEVEEDVEPMVAEEAMQAAVPVEAGQVAGVHQLVRGFFEGKEVVSLEVTIALGAEDPRDEVTLDTDPAPLTMIVPGGAPGDSATAWAVCHAAGAIVQMKGLVTVLDLRAGR